mmetsp:Transcript_60445/g.166040  ORF Transcript_60445/g.166040 Transcript_60445/m.166040 type:complete len:211 (+) Transcript_60445:1302-1934(+)
MITPRTMAVSSVFHTNHHWVMSASRISLTLLYGTGLIHRGRRPRPWRRCARCRWWIPTSASALPLPTAPTVPMVMMMRHALAAPRSAHPPQPASTRSAAMSANVLRVAQRATDSRTSPTCTVTSGLAPTSMELDVLTRARRLSPSTDLILKSSASPSVEGCSVASTTTKGVTGAASSHRLWPSLPRLSAHRTLTHQGTIRSPLLVLLIAR